MREQTGKYIESKKLQDIGISVDGYCEETKTVYQFHGCYWHGCDKCYNPKKINSQTRQSFKLLKDKSDLCDKLITDAGYNLVLIWEHDFDKLPYHPEIDESDLPIKNNAPLTGGRTETFTALSKDINAMYYDFNSLYPYVQSNCEYPSGKRVVYSNPEKWDKNWFGFAKVYITPPKNLMYPVLPAKSLINGVNGEYEKLLFDLNLKIGTWCTPEINKALEMGYTIDKIYYVHHYSERRSDIFKGYMNEWAKIKIERDGFPDNVDKKKYIEDFKINQGIELDETNIRKNPGMRSVAKILSNSLWGKFGENLDKVESVYININDEKAVEKKDKIYSRIKSTCLINEDIDAFSITREEIETYKMSMTIAAFTTCWGRLQLYSALEEIDKQGGIVLYCDTDSVIFTDAKLQTGPYYGQFKNELGDGYITDFVSIGAKSYAFKTNNDEIL